MTCEIWLVVAFKWFYVLLRSIYNQMKLTTGKNNGWILSIVIAPYKVNQI